MPAAGTLEGPKEVTEFLEDISRQYEKVHVGYEDNFWSTKMNLAGCSGEALVRTKTEYESFLGDAKKLEAVREMMKRPDLSPEQSKVLSVMERTFGCYITEDDRAKELKEKLNTLEAELAGARNKMALGLKDPSTGEFRAASSVQLRNLMRVEDAEPTRRAAFDALRAIGPFVAGRFCEIVKARNELARLCGYEDFYDMKVTQAEGFGKARLFTIMDGLEARTRGIMEAARARLAKEKGAAALEPHNIGHALAGDTTRLTDPYFPFEEAVDVWGRTFAALGIDYRGSLMTLDLCDREGKYSNGFCHWPQPAWRRADGSWQPAVANFTSLATPNEPGSGKTALVTLLHEGGHAAHFANVDQHSPFFSQERAPTSVAYAENQSMFLDSLASDAAWLGRYARDREGNPIPWELVERLHTDSHPYEVFQVRAMLAVPYFEKALYELPEDQVTPEALQALADDVERRVQGGLSPRPLLSVPHILADESSAYYHGYVLAEMSVHQTRDHFLATEGRIVDNPNVGAALTRAYWTPGNSAMFLDLVEGLTGRPLSGDAWVARLQLPLEQLLVREKEEYGRAIKEGPSIPPGADFDIGMAVRLVHGDEVIADSRADGGLRGACSKFKAWVRAKYFGGKA
ncbi:oligoendopeptidase f [Raphidocelis subcapitata]|uniref:Oligoendopeptidase f n=1 Tax=Raphidocelis subcapitata TaxID=307507 RepID=A0A2V0NMT1_9CHLO|nr:oligoendopeptidase f [Raphidocelis subcapitata]|eukprot:GBF88826.1 oligoendopeptidase f [Raphidocelis subcapitata]